jgi:RNA cap guanine-N2 methyltransferase
MGKKGRKSTALPQKHRRKYKHQAQHNKKRRHRRLYWIQDCPDLLPLLSDENDAVNAHDAILIKLTEIHLEDDLHGCANDKISVENAINNDASNQPPKKSNISIISHSNLDKEYDIDVKPMSELLPKESDALLRHEGEQQQQNNIKEVSSLQIQQINSTVDNRLPISTTETNVNSSVARRTPKVYIQRIQSQKKSRFAMNPSNYIELPNGNNGDGICNPYNPNIVPHKYWAQRKRLFHLYDNGIQMGTTEKEIGEAFFSITPQCIAQHIAKRMIQYHNDNIRSKNEISTNEPLIIVDAFVGVGGNAIALALQDPNVVVVCIDIDIHKLYCTAHNACNIYHIPQHQLLLLHHDACAILAQFYSNGKKRKPGDFILSVSTWSKAKNNDAAIDLEKMCGYGFISSFDDLPNYINGAFLSPPWGGINYEDVGPRHFSIQSNIELVSSTNVSRTANITTAATCTTELCPVDGTNGDATLVAMPTTNNNDDIMVNGEMLLQFAVQALPIDQLNISYYLPRNLNGIMFGQSCYNILIRDDNDVQGQLHHRQREYYHHIELEQNIVNTKLKTVTAYIHSLVDVK